MTHRPLRLAALALLAGVPMAHAANIIASGPLKMAADDYYSCTAVNAGTSSLASVDVKVTIAGSNPGSGAHQVCEPVGPGEACEAQNQAGGSTYRFCSITVIGNRRGVRGTFCDTTKGICIPVQ